MRWKRCCLRKAGEMRFGTACISCHCHKNMALSVGTAFPVSRGCQPRNRAVRDVVGASDLAHRLAVDVAPASRLALLKFRQFRFAAKLDSAPLGALPALAGAGTDQVALELGQPAQNIPP